jgi:hypothetical protein
MRTQLARWLAVAVLFALLAGWAVQRALPPLPASLPLTVVFPAGSAGESQPLVTTGNAGSADFLYVKFVDATTVVFGYDSWAFGGPLSAPVPIVAGRAYGLGIEMPALAQLSPPPTFARRRLRLTLDGRELLNHEVFYRGRHRAEVWFGENPVGGTTTGRSFGGTLTTEAGLPLRGFPSALVPWTGQLHTWLTQLRGEVAALALLSVAFVFWLPPAWRWACAWWRKPRPEPLPPSHERAPHRWFLATTAVCTLAFATVLTGGTFRLIFPESFGSFYDHQAASLLAGHLDVPEEAVSSEAFVFHGKYYGYFGPTPALLRLPFVVTGVAFGQLSRGLMVFYFVGCLAAAYALLIFAARHLSQRATWPSAGATVLLVGSAGLGSTLFFTASRAYVYHEAILCGAMFALWSTWFSLRYLTGGSERRSWPAALGCGLLALHARPPAGLFALVLLGIVAAIQLARVWSGPHKARRAPLLVGALAVLGVLSFNALSYLKFQSFDGAPLRYHIQYTPERLAIIGGRNFHLTNLRFNIDSYVWRPSFELRRSFPWFYTSGADPADYDGTRIDLAEQTLPVPYAMPALTLLALAAIGCALFRWPGARLPVAVLLLGALPLSLALFTAIAISHRYTADFIPPLVGAAAFGLTALPTLPTGLRRIVTTLAVLLALVSLFITLAITLHYQGEGVWGVPAEITARYLSIRQQMDLLLGFSRP